MWNLNFLFWRVCGLEVQCAYWNEIWEIIPLGERRNVFFYIFLIQYRKDESAMIQESPFYFKNGKWFEIFEI